MNPANQTGAGQRPQTIVESALSSVERGVEELASAIEGLADGASGVLRPGLPPPQDTASAKQLAAIEPEHCSVVKNLHGQRQRIEQLVNRVTELRSRLEV